MHQLSPTDMTGRKLYNWSYQLQKRISDLLLFPIDPSLFVQLTCVTHFLEDFLKSLAG